ncbi:hypothetical protein C8R47DRAFT_168003 [Mycena vitilis]|nr:hypothetical protein C8R47DRAFT_168003 [Mycena vitilis]
MVGFALILLFLAGTSPLVSVASPLAGLSATSQLKGISVFPPTHPGLLCENPVFQSVCSRLAMVQGIQVTTPIGVARGASDGSGVNRFPVKYASAARWAVSTVSINWTLPTGATNASGLPLACPQPDVDVSTYTEDCLSMILYVPITLNASSRVPTLLWIHGGSFIAGSATGPGLDGSNLRSRPTPLSQSCNTASVLSASWAPAAQPTLPSRTPSTP